MYHIYHNIKIDARIDKVFDCCTNPIHINNWWTKQCSGIPELGEEYMFWFAPEYDWRAKVSDLKREEEVAFTFYKADHFLLKRVKSIHSCILDTQTGSGIMNTLVEPTIVGLCISYH